MKSLLLINLFLLCLACERGTSQTSVETLPGDETSKESVRPGSLSQFYQVNLEYSQVFLANALDEKPDIALREVLQLEKQHAAQAYDEAIIQVSEQEQKVKALEEKYQDLSQLPPTTDNKNKQAQVSEELRLAREELAARIVVRDRAQVTYTTKSQNFSQFSAQVKAKTDRLYRLERQNDLSLDDYYLGL